MDTKTFVQNEIFQLREKAALYLQAGDTAAVARIQITIAHLQEVHGVSMGVERKPEMDTVNGERAQSETKLPMTEHERIERTIFYLRSAESLFLAASDTGSFDELRELIADFERQRQTLKPEGRQPCKP